MAGCGGDDSAGGSGTTSSNENIELTLGTFGEFGYEDLIKEYEGMHSNIKIKHDKVGQGGPYHEALLTKLAGGSGAYDVSAVEEGHLSDVLSKPQLFNNLEEIGPKDVTKDRWLGWKYDAAKAKDGTLIGYGTDIGPLAMCYRKDLLQAAGMPFEPEAVKPLFATWDSFFQAGDTYVKATGKAWYDSNSQIFNAMQNQLPVGYVNKDDKLVIEENADIKKNWDKVTAAGARGQTAKLAAFSNEWNSGFKTGAFATKTCPAWMLGVIKGQAGPENEGKWAVTDAFPNGGGNWGGSYLSVPKQSKHPKEAAELAAWLTAPEQQIKAFKAKGTFPSQVKALEAGELLSTTNPYFGGIKDGELFAKMAQKVGPAQYKGPGDGQIQENATSPALQAVEQGASPEDGWKQAVDAAKRIAR
ncbi:MAG TPA: ABC transporter substrate-binding protein [Actinophytocola sp.]|uniref:ABC transporter substrate-binding protein n=1 Tax=Actinophytocola sp. TaxID=1872138 RepID=UPI002DB5D66F|nr:ABC transporter substrate-binding protein [Actinophytocola sp.]HEU5474403.1 ABC transporter substrate-binding protein [Actinophytocola sp.]